MKKTYSEPVIEIEVFDCDNVIYASGWSIDDGYDENDPNGEG